MHKMMWRGAIIGCGILLTVSLGARAEPPAKRVFIVQSYEKGHVCGEPQAEGELKALARSGWVEGRNLTVAGYWMDTYRTNTSPETMQREGEKALAEIA